MKQASIVIAVVVTLTAKYISLGSAEQSRMKYALVTRSVIQEFARIKSEYDPEQCWERGICNMIVDKANTTVCKTRLASLSGGAPESSENHCRVSCLGYGLAVSSNRRWTNNPDGTCEAGQHLLGACDSWCFSQGVWVIFSKVCANTLFQGHPSVQVVGGAELSTWNLPFELSPGHVLSVQVTGTYKYDNNIDLVEMPSIHGDHSFPLRLRLIWRRRRALYVTKLLGREEETDVLKNIPVPNINNFTIDIHLLRTQYKTYIDGSLLMRRKMRIPFNNVKTVTMWGFKYVHMFRIGADVCHRH